MSSQSERDLSASPLEGDAEEVLEVEGAASAGPQEAPAPDGPSDAQILSDVAAISAERDEYLAALQRTQADFANYRKRVLRQQEEQAVRAASDLVAKLLPVLDTLDLAETHLETKEGEESNEALALRQARTLLMDTLHREGLERIDAVGVSFDPSIHDAVAHAPSEEGAGEEPGARIDEVMRAGYRWRGHTLRPAMVRVRG